MLYHLRQDNIWSTFWEVFCLTDDSGPDTDNPGVWIPESPMAGATSFRNDQKYVGYWPVKKNQYRIIPQQSKKLYGKSCLTSHNREIMPPFIFFISDSPLSSFVGAHMDFAGHFFWNHSIGGQVGGHFSIIGNFKQGKHDNPHLLL